MRYQPSHGPSPHPHAECWFGDSLIKNNKSVGLFDRSPSAGMHQELEPNSGLLNSNSVPMGWSYFHDHTNQGLNKGENNGKS